MTELYRVTDYQVAVDQLQHPDMNYPTFIEHTNQELNKFVAMIAALNADYISPQDVGGVGGLNCRFHSINGYPAIRQMTQFDPASKSWSVWFDCRVLTRANVKADGDASAKLEPLTQETDTPLPGEQPLDQPAPQAN